MRQPIILHDSRGRRIILGPGWTLHEREGHSLLEIGDNDPVAPVETFDEIARAVDAMHVLEDDEAGKRVEKAGGPAQEAGLVALEVPTELIDTYNAARRALLEVPLTDPDAPSPAYNTARAAVLATAPTAAEVANRPSGLVVDTARPVCSYPGCQAPPTRRIPFPRGLALTCATHVGEWHSEPL